jgi:hypothetical protein
MPPAPPNSPAGMALALLGLMGLAVFAGTMAAWLQLVLRIGKKTPLWPAFRTRAVPWHGGTWFFCM